jgi:alpha-galactosidase
MLFIAGQLRSAMASDLPGPDGEEANHGKKVQVFILMGESNMLGFGRIEPQNRNGTLANLIQENGMYGHLIDDEGKWSERKDVRNVHVMCGKVMKNEWLGAQGKHIGPDLQFGYIMGHFHDEPVLILKSCTDNRSLGLDLLPPGSEQFEFEGRVYAGYKDTPSSWVKGEPKEVVNWYAGKQYDIDVSEAKRVLSDLSEFYPGYKDQGYDIAGFVFWQGHKDQNAAHASRYEQNLAQFIKTLRKEFHAPDAKFVCATIAFGGEELSGHGLTVANAQLAVSGEKGKYPEFKGNVMTIDARPFWIEEEYSPSGAGHYYNHNAETYMEVGNAFGWAMVDLLRRQ